MFSLIRTVISPFFPVSPQDIQSDQYRRNRQACVLNPKPYEIIVPLVPSKMPADKLTSICRSIGDRPEKFGEGNNCGADAKRDPFLPPRGFKEEKKSRNDEQRYET